MSQPTVQPQVRVRASMAQNRGPQNTAIPDLGKLVRTEADNFERNKRRSRTQQQSNFDLNQIADGGRTKQNRASLKGKFIDYLESYRVKIYLRNLYISLGLIYLFSSSNRKGCPAKTSSKAQSSTKTPILSPSRSSLRLPSLRHRRNKS